MRTAVALVSAYLIGSLDFAVVVARAHGVDIHSVGSGNPGTSNVLRTLGKGPAAMVFLGDLLKGVVAAAMGFLVAGGGETALGLTVAAGLAAVIGHCYPVFHRFRGGKGVATAAGVFFFVTPLAAIILAGMWVAVARLTRVASIASLSVAVLALPLAWWREVPGAALGWMAAILVLIVWRHRPNIRRMIRGSEQKVVS